MDAKPLPEPMLTYDQLNDLKETFKNVREKARYLEVREQNGTDNSALFSQDPYHLMQQQCKCIQAHDNHSQIWLWYLR